MMDKLETALEKARQERASASTVRQNADLPVRASLASQLPLGSTPLTEAVCEQNRIIAALAKHPYADLFRLLRTQVLQTMYKHNLKTLAVTSPNYGEGKTTIAINLALSIALDLNQTVLLVDLDLRKPSVHSYLGLRPRTGLTDYLTGRSTLADGLMRMTLNRMTVLAAGGEEEQSSEILASPKMASLARELRERYPDRLIIYDMPPLLAQDDPLTFLPHVDGVLLVAKEGETPVADVKRSLEILSSANVIGTVLNDRQDLFSKDQWMDLLPSWF